MFKNISFGIITYINAKGVIMKNTKDNIVRNKWFYSVELIIDLVIVAISYYFGFRLQRPDLFISTLPANVALTLIYVLFASMIFFIAFKIHRCGEKPYSTTILFIFIALPTIALSSIFIDYIIKGVGIWRRTMFYAVCFQIPAFLIIKLIASKVHKYAIKLKPSIVIGESKEEAAQYALKIIDDNNNLYSIKHLIAQNSKRLYQCIQKNVQVFICPSVTDERKKELIEYCVVNKIDCSIAPSINDIIINSGKFYNASDAIFFNMDIKLDNESRIVKRAIDIIISFISLIILLPIMLIISLLIKLEDGGKVTYSQIRVTKNNKEFKIYKFRTMIENAESETGAVLAQREDSRITRLGRFLRKSRLDEVPQLVNVFIGDMTLVGPRPERPELMQEVIEHTPEFKYRTLVKAGLTGLAQTMGRYDTIFINKLLLDLYYVNNHSLLFDLKILFYTLNVLTTPSATSGVSNDNENIFEIFSKKGYIIEKKDDYFEVVDHT